MTPLEHNYRTLLRLLPRAYRDAWEDEMVAAFLEAAVPEEPEDAELAVLGRPSLSESASVVGLAVRLRLGAVEASPRGRLWADAAGRVALVGLLLSAVLSAVELLNALWLTGALRGVPSPAIAVQLAPQTWRTGWGVATALAVPAYLALLARQVRVAAVLAVLGLAPFGAATVLDVAQRGEWRDSVPSVYVLLLLVL